MDIFLCKGFSATVWTLLNGINCTRIKVNLLVQFVYGLLSFLEKPSRKMFLSMIQDFGQVFNGKWIFDKPRLYWINIKPTNFDSSKTYIVLNGLLDILPKQPRVLLVNIFFIVLLNWRTTFWNLIFLACNSPIIPSVFSVSFLQPKTSINQKAKNYQIKFN